MMCMRDVSLLSLAIISGGFLLPITLQLSMHLIVCFNVTKPGHYQGRMSGWVTVIVCAIFAALAGALMWSLRWQLGAWFIHDKK
eukprot:scaffold508827_cov38-Prasinocladus_malaysianus.AAC.1